MSKSEFDKDYKRIKKTAKAGIGLFFINFIIAWWKEFPKKTKWAVARWWVIWSILVLYDTPTTNTIGFFFFLWGFRKPIIITEQGDKIPSIFTPFIFSFNEIKKAFKQKTPPK